jgi:hypothetical protein
MVPRNLRWFKKAVFLLQLNNRKYSDLTDDLKESLQDYALNVHTISRHSDEDVVFEVKPAASVAAELELFQPSLSAATIVHLSPCRGCFTCVPLSPPCIQQCRRLPCMPA